MGWGSKQTQFHGSLGKAAASSEVPTTGQGGIDKPSPDDDKRPRVSWRGDGAFFVVSSLDPHGSDSNHALRRLRFYSSNPPAHLSTSEITPGLEGVLAWRPSGGLIASAQRFGYEGGGIGRPGRHDVVFFERCGLRRGEFGIRDSVVSTGASGTNSAWGYKVKELLWNTDSTILALWIQREAGDCGMSANLPTWAFTLTTGAERSAAMDNRELPLVSQTGNRAPTILAIHLRCLAPRNCVATHMRHSPCVVYMRPNSPCLTLASSQTLLRIAHFCGILVRLTQILLIPQDA